MKQHVTRRRVLAATAGLSMTGLGLSDHLASRPAYTHYTYAQTDETGDGRLRVAWVEFYNGSVLEDQQASNETNATRILDPETAPTYVDEPTGPVVAIQNAMPGDRGALAVGLLVEDLAEGEDGMDLWVRATLTENAENGVLEPETKSPQEDDPGDGSSAGELGDTIQTRVWRDSGVAAGVGACNGAFDPGEDVLQQGTAVETMAALDDGVQVAECLPRDAHRCFGLEWVLPSSVGNQVQTDSIGFDLTFVGQSCGRGNPFTTEADGDE